MSDLREFFRGFPYLFDLLYVEFGLIVQDKVTVETSS